ncbi:MAG: hypothetical protein K0B05_03735 [Bacteroidales bacterium]|nr:hypothetical protein [Bacteroidales bacterium]
MKPDRSNYEIWFIDWLDGKLDESQVQQLQEFLDGNPDLMEEFKVLAPVHLKPPDGSFVSKESLKKRPGDLTDSQFEYLCIASLENDLSPAQAGELHEAMADDPAKSQIYNLVNKIKLVPAETRYLHKSKLKRVGVYAKVFRISLALSGAAAAVALFLTLFTPDPAGMHQPELPVAIIMIPPAITGPQADEPEDAIIAEAQADEPAESIIRETPAAVSHYYATSDSVKNYVPDFPVMNLSPAPVPGKVFIAGIYEARSSLVEYEPGLVVPLFPDERSNVNRFFARLFHEKIMRDSTAGDRPVKGYEIAEAGIAGLNKLLGTGIALQRNTDENGEVRSVYFSSGLLKFNAPVKKTGTLQ